MNIVCDRKKAYDTEFEVDVRIARLEHEWETELIKYPCGSHWHIASKDPAKRSQHIVRTYCEVCKQPIRRGRYDKHAMTGYHQARIEKEES